MVDTQRYIETVRYLDALYMFLNERLFDGELGKPVITVQLDERNRRSGWFTPDKVWKETADDEGAYEINLAAQDLNRPASEIAATLLHEMCHYYAKTKNLKDLSSDGKRHNKLFKRVAETHGLTVEEHRTQGWAKTALNADALVFVQEFMQAHPETVIFRVPVRKGKPIRISNVRKYECPVCGQSVKATKEVHVICADCDALMTEEEIGKIPETTKK